MNILVLSDHRGHSNNNSLYGMARAIARRPEVNKAVMADRANPKNHRFFEGEPVEKLQVIDIDEAFKFDNLREGKLNSRTEDLFSFDAIFLRLAWPINKHFFQVLPSYFPNRVVVNDPHGILKTSNKKYLFNFPDFTPPMELCQTWEQLLELTKDRDTVLKPLENYGGRGLARIKNSTVWYEGQNLSLSEFNTVFESVDQGFLAVPYLKNVGKGDKRIFVAGGKIIFSSLRLPQSGGWLCNIAQGGSSSPAVANNNERQMIEQITPKLAEEGIFYYGVDTLVNNRGKRVISEINTLSIGGLTPNEKDDRTYLANRFAKLFVHYIQSKSSHVERSDH